MLRQQPAKFFASAWCRQSLQDVTEIGPGFYVMAFATGQRAEEDGGGVATGGVADEEPALPAQGDTTQ